MVTAASDFRHRSIHHNCGILFLQTKKKDGRYGHDDDVVLPVDHNQSVFQIRHWSMMYDGSNVEYNSYPNSIRWYHSQKVTKKKKKTMHHFRSFSHQDIANISIFHLLNLVLLLDCSKIWMSYHGHVIYIIWKTKHEQEKGRKKIRMSARSQKQRS